MAKNSSFDRYANQNFYFFWTRKPMFKDDSYKAVEIEENKKNGDVEKFSFWRKVIKRNKEVNHRTPESAKKYIKGYDLML